MMAFVRLPKVVHLLGRRSIQLQWLFHTSGTYN
jgi:hypothetical protein